MGIYNRAAFMLTLFHDHIFKKRTPLVVVLNVTFRCNLRCGYCYGQYFDRQDEDFKTEELLGLIDELAKLGTRSNHTARIKFGWVASRELQSLS